MKISEFEKINKKYNDFINIKDILGYISNTESKGFNEMEYRFRLHNVYCDVHDVVCITNENLLAIKDFLTKYQQMLKEQIEEETQ